MVHRKMLRILILLVLPLCIAAAPIKFGACDVVISELNTDTPGNNDFFEFIELMSVFCPHGRAPALQNYIVLLIEAHLPRMDAPAIVFSADLYRQSMKKGSNYFVIGSPNKELKPDLSFSDNSVGFYRRGQMKQTSINKFFTKKTAPVQATNVLTNGNRFRFKIHYHVQNNSAFNFQMF
ncbi:MAG: hypothetical protein GY820_00710 [Gammaproteobacteria bacterium]|nr:hypothetical protein [Gammaproteobacteria bacterium]